MYGHAHSLNNVAVFYHICIIIIPCFEIYLVNPSASLQQCILGIHLDVCSVIQITTEAFVLDLHRLLLAGS